MNDFYIFCAKYLIFVIALAAFIYWMTLARKDKIRLALAVFVAAILAYLSVKVAGKFYDHPRPFVVEHIKPLISHGADNSFPSEHAAGAAAIATAVYFFAKRYGVTLFALAVLVAVGRVGTHVHWKIDVITGLALGLISGAIGYYASMKIKLPDAEKHERAKV